MKHGPIALIDENMPVVFIAPRGRVYQKVLSNIEEVKARGGRVIAITTDGNGELDRLADHIVTVPTTHEMLQPVLTSRSSRCSCSPITLPFFAAATSTSPATSPRASQSSKAGGRCAGGRYAGTPVAGTPVAGSR
jgi:hypothetical protein